MSRHHSLVTALAVLFLASPLAAQGLTQEGVALAPTTSAATIDSSNSMVPRVAPVSISTMVTHQDASSSAARLSSSGTDQSTNTAMMVVGGAALLVGAVVGGKAGTILMIGGSLVGLVGLWNYMR